MFGFSIVRQYERLMMLKLGKFIEVRGPGLRWIWPIINDGTRKLDLRERFMAIPSQTAITRDNAPIDIDFLIGDRFDFRLIRCNSDWLVDGLCFFCAFDLEIFDRFRSVGFKSERCQVDDFHGRNPGNRHYHCWSGLVLLSSALASSTPVGEYISKSICNCIRHIGQTDFEDVVTIGNDRHSFFGRNVETVVFRCRQVRLGDAIEFRTV